MATSGDNINHSESVHYYSETNSHVFVLMNVLIVSLMILMCHNVYKVQICPVLVQGPWWLGCRTLFCIL